MRMAKAALEAMVKNIRHTKNVPLLNYTKVAYKRQRRAARPVVKSCSTRSGIARLRRSNHSFRARSLMTQSSSPSQPSSASSRQLISGLVAYAERDRVVNEVHARPFHPLRAPTRLIHLAFLTDDAAREADKSWFYDTYMKSAEPLEKGSNPRRVELNGVVVRWEPHTEFTTYTIETPLEENTARFGAYDAEAMLAAAGIRQPGPLLVAVDVCVIRAESFTPEMEPLFDRASLAVSRVEGGAGVIATDFRQEADGRIRILVLNGSMNKWQTGPLVQRVIEFETYRTLALLGLAEAQRVGPSVRKIEKELARLTQEMRSVNQLEENNFLLDHLTRLAADLEAQAVETSYRFGATRAYHQITELRLGAIREEPYEGYSSWASFMARRLAPAIRTCNTISDRQADLSRKLTRAANLLRTRVDVEIERQNRDLLRSMNTRSELQLRLQTTVEGLSIAAISYYIVGLLSYLARGAQDAGLPVSPYIITGLAVPIVLGLAWLALKRIRKRHFRQDKAG